nr:hypothetical protein [Tanacetum cinerariifolium]
MLAVARGHSGGGDPSRLPPRSIGTGCRGVRGRKATREVRGGSRDGGSKGTGKETKNPGLKKVTNEYGPLKIRGVPYVLPFLTQNQGGCKGGGLGMAHVTIGLALITLPESLKMLKTGKRVRSSAGRDPAHWLSSKISRWRASRPVSTRPSYRPSSTLTLMAANLRMMRLGFNMLLRSSYHLVAGDMSSRKVAHVVGDTMPIVDSVNYGNTFSGDLSPGILVGKIN